MMKDPHWCRLTGRDAVADCAGRLDVSRYWGSPTRSSDVTAICCLRRTAYVISLRRHQQRNVEKTILRIWHEHASVDLSVTYYLRTCCEPVCFWQRLCVCVSVHTKSQKLLFRNWCNLAGICPVMNAKSDWKSVTFDLDLWPWEVFSYFFICHARRLPLGVSNALTQWVWVCRGLTSHSTLYRSFRGRPLM